MYNLYKDTKAFKFENITFKNGKGFNNSEQRLINSGSLDGQEGLEIDKDFIRSEETEERMWSQRGIARLAIDMSGGMTILVGLEQ